MATAAVQQKLDDYMDQISDLLDQIDANDAELQRQKNLVTDYKRQQSVHQSHVGNPSYPTAQDDLNTVVGWLNGAQSEVTRLTQIKKDLADQYTTTKQKYTDLKADFLTPEEQAAQAAKEQAAADARAAAAASADQKDQTNFMQKNTWYLIGAVVLIILVIGGMLVYKKSKQ